jgi:hypothetical protein
MGLDVSKHFRISKYEDSQIDKYRIDVSKVCRKALMAKIREFVTDPTIIISEGENGPAAIYLQSWNRIMPGLTSMLTHEDYVRLRDSHERLEDLKRIVDWSYLKPVEIQQMGLFLQGGDLSERILMNCVEAHLDAHL